MTSILRRTPLFPLYAGLGGRTVDFNGWLMPLQFSGILGEHAAVRERAGLFDVSHMGEIEVSGDRALAALQWILTNDASKLAVGRALYSPVCHENGGTVDDVVVYRLAADDYLVVVNAGNIERDVAWFSQHARGARVVDRSAEYAQLALQGPLAAAILTDAAVGGTADLAHYSFAQGVSVCGRPCLVSRTGYTGEDGFELYMAPDDAQTVYTGLLEHGAARGLLPAGLGARDTLRLEARLPLYGHELADDITPLEAGLQSFVKWDKGDFCGRAALREQLDHGLARRLRGLAVLERGIPRAGYAILAAQQDSAGPPIGFVTSGTMSPTLGVGIGLALLEDGHGTPDERVAVDVRGRAVAAKIVKTPFYRRTT